MQPKLFNTQAQVLSVSQYNSYINELLSYELVRVEGEVSNYRPVPGRNFCYFDIKDEKSIAKCFQGFWSCKKIELKNGLKIQVSGFPSMQKNGSLVIDLRDIMLSGEGALMEAYLKLKEKMEREGLFDEKNKKPIPMFPRTIGLISGKNSSAYFDVVAEINERWKGVKILFFPCKVQGLNSKKEIVAAIRWFNYYRPVDTLIIARGGGSMEDLQAFDSEEVVREIFASNIPIVSAIGHEDHWTLSDFVSDVRAKTPTKAAQISVPDQRETNERLEYFSERANNLLVFQLKAKVFQLSNLEHNLKTSLQKQIQEKSNRLKDLAATSFQAAKKNLTSKIDYLGFLEKQLELLNPLKVLVRGYAVVEKSSRRISSINQIRQGDQILATLHDGQISARVENVKKISK